MGITTLGLITWPCRRYPPQSTGSSPCVADIICSTHIEQSLPVFTLLLGVDYVIGNPALFCTLEKWPLSRIDPPPAVGFQSSKTSFFCMSCNNHRGYHVERELHNTSENSYGSVLLFRSPQICLRRTLKWAHVAVKCAACSVVASMAYSKPSRRYITLKTPPTKRAGFHTWTSPALVLLH